MLDRVISMQIRWKSGGRDRDIEQEWLLALISTIWKEQNQIAFGTSYERMNYCSLKELCFCARYSSAVYILSNRILQINKNYSLCDTLSLLVSLKRMTYDNLT